MLKIPTIWGKWRRPSSHLPAPVVRTIEFPANAARIGPKTRFHAASSDGPAVGQGGALIPRVTQRLTDPTKAAV